MNFITKFFHEMFNPHCIHCDEQKRIEAERRDIEIEESKHCNACEFSQMEIARLHQLINKLTSENEQTTTPVTEHKVIVPPNTFVPWHLKRQGLEAASRLKAAEKRAEADIKVPVPVNVEKLEKEIGLEDARSTETGTA